MPSTCEVWFSLQVENIIPLKSTKFNWLGFGWESNPSQTVWLCIF